MKPLPYFKETFPYFKETIPIYEMNLKQNIIYGDGWR